MKSQLEIVPVKWIDKVLEIALTRAPVALPEDEVKVEEAKPAATAEGAAPVVTDATKH